MASSDNIVELVKEIVPWMATLAIAAVGVVTANPVTASSLSSIALSVSSGLGTNRLEEQLRKGWLLSNYGQANHDIKKALARAFKTAIEELLNEYVENLGIGALDIRHLQQIKSLRKELTSRAEGYFLDPKSKLSDKEVRALVDEGEVEVASTLWSKLEEESLLGRYGRLHSFLRGHLVRKIGFYFLEELKKDTPEALKAWRAYQRLLVISLHESIQKGQLEHRESHGEAIDMLGRLLERIDALEEDNKRVRDEPLQEVISNSEEILKTLAQYHEETLAKIEEGHQDLRTRIESVPGIVRSDLEKLVLPEVAAMLESYGRWKKPHFGELFEIITRVDDLGSAIFRSEDGMHASQSPYLGERGDLQDVLADMRRALNESPGALLVKGRAGLGKTREVVRLVEECARSGWKVCVAREKGDRQLDELDHFPATLKGIDGPGILLVFDDLHRRVDPASESRKSYTERLEAFLSYLDSKFAPGEYMVVATVRSEERLWNTLGFDTEKPPWNRFGVYNLPEFTDVQLTSLLKALSESAGVTLSVGPDSLVKNSDRLPRTLAQNVRRASTEGYDLNPSTWLPTRGVQWNTWFSRVRRSHPAVETVYQALYLLHEAGAPTRYAYVVDLTNQICGSGGAEAINALLDMRLLAQREDIVDSFSDEQLRESSYELPSLDEYWDFIVEVLSSRKQIIEDDLISVAQAQKFTRGHYLRVEQLLEVAIQNGLESAIVYFHRGLVRFFQDNFAGAEEDFDEATKGGLEGADVYHYRGLVRNFRGNYTGAEEDFGEAIMRGEKGAGIYNFRGISRYYQGNYAGAEEDFGEATKGGLGHHLRGRARYYQGNYAGAEEDFDEVIKGGRKHPLVYYFRGVVRYYQGNYADAEEDFDEAIRSGLEDAIVYGLRGGVRFFQDNYAGAEEDFDEAIKGGLEDAHFFFFKGLACLAQSNYSGAETDFDEAIDRGTNDADVYYLRGGARLHRGNNVGAEADFEEAIKRGSEEAHVYFYEEALVYFYKGDARFGQGDNVGAEADFEEAIERGIYNYEEQLVNEGAREVFEAVLRRMLE